MIRSRRARGMDWGISEGSWVVKKFGRCFQIGKFSLSALLMYVLVATSAGKMPAFQNRLEACSTVFQLVA